MSSSALTFDDDAAARKHCDANVTVFDVGSVVQEWQLWVRKLAEARFRPPSERHKGDFNNHCVPFMQACFSGKFMLLSGIHGDVRFKAYAMSPVTHLQIETCSEYFIVRLVFDNDARVNSERIKIAFYAPRSYFVMQCMHNPSVQVRREGVWRLSPMCAYAGVARGVHALKEIPIWMRESSCHVDAASKALLTDTWNDLGANVFGKFAFCKIDNQGIPQLHRTARREDVMAQSDASEIGAASSSLAASVRQAQLDALEIAAATSFQAASVRQAQRRTQRLRQNAQDVSLSLSYSLGSSSSAAAPELVVCQSFMCKLMFKQMQELKEDHMCSICLDETEEDTHRVLSCGHFLCSGCMGNPEFDWTCPQCRGNIRKIS